MIDQRQSFYTVVWLCELVAAGPNVYPIHCLKAMELAGQIAAQWPQWLRDTIADELI